MPSVKAIWEFWRETPPMPALVLDRPACFLCEHDALKGLERHHILPVYLGGSNELENLILLCGECHRQAPDEAFAMRRWLRIIWDEIGWADPRSQKADGLLLLVRKIIGSTADFLSEDCRRTLLRQVGRRAKVSGPHFAIAELKWKTAIMRSHRRPAEPSYD